MMISGHLKCHGNHFWWAPFRVTRNGMGTIPGGQENLIHTLLFLVTIGNAMDDVIVDWKSIWHHACLVTNPEM